MRFGHVLLSILVATVAAAGCGDDSTSEGGAGGTGGESASPQDGPTYYKDVLPILQKNCVTCHWEGRIGGFSLAEYDQAKPQAGLMAAVTENGTMPPWHAIETDDCKPRFGFVGDPRLSEEDKATLRAWSDANAPAGDPADAPAPFTPADVGLEAPDLEMVPVEPSFVAGDNDQFVCVVYDPTLTETRYVDGISIMPGNAKVTHHALVFRVDRGTAESASGGEERFSCFGAPPGDLIHAWAPGQLPLQLPEGVGMPLGADQVIVVQMHYHPTSTSEEEDSSMIQLSYMSEEPDWEFAIALPGNESSAPGLLPDPDDRDGPEFRIPANVKDHVESMVVTVPNIPIELPVLVVGTHMHYVGRDARFWIERNNPKADEPAEECLVQTPAWDFNWQRGYMFDVPISELPTLSSGDKLRLECRYDNSMSNRFVAEALAQEGLSAPHDVYLGEQTLDEMCLGAIGFLTPH